MESPPPHSSSPLSPQLSLRRPLPPPLPPIPIPGYDGIMSDDPMAIVFNLDPRLQGNRSTNPLSMPSRKGMMSRFQGTGFFDSFRARLNRFDEGSSFFGPSKSQKHPQKEEGEKTPLVVRTSAESLVPGIDSIPNSGTSTPLPPPPPAKNEDKLPKHSNVFTGVPTPTDTAANSRSHSSANSVDAGGRSDPPNRTHRVKGVPGLEASLKEYCYIEEPKEKNELEKMPSPKEPQPFTNPGKTAKEVEALENDAATPKGKGKGKGPFLGAGGPEVGGPGSCQSRPWKSYVSQGKPQQQRQRLPDQSPLNTLKALNQNCQTRTQGLIEEVPEQGQIFIPSVSQRLHSWEPEGEVGTIRERLHISISTSTSPLLKFMRPPTDGALIPNPQFTLPFLRSAATISPDELPQFSEQSMRPHHLRQDSELFPQPTKDTNTPEDRAPDSLPVSTNGVGIPELGAVSNVGVPACWDTKPRDPFRYAHPNIPRRNALSPSSDPGSPTGSFIGHRELTRFARDYAARMPSTLPGSPYSPSDARSADGDRHGGGREGVSEDGQAEVVLGRTRRNPQVHALRKGMAGFVPLLHQVPEVMLSRDESLFLMKIGHILFMAWAMWALAKLLGIGTQLMQIIILEPGRVLCHALKRWLGG
ncbi:unnamed protein product [Tuber aestivum]|uniref:Uncharacterized protein n=1 Tax=Tuber aestivum TaxID=59557 RepID=A0A292PQZ4_9PEZI|nr:unnamed protein product [Tuber aestivum]